MSEHSPAPAPQPYHHGDLRRALVEAAIDLLRDTQGWDFSLREVARRAGVSHNAPYSHFADKRGLLGAVAIVGYHMLRDQMLEAKCASSDAANALNAIGRAYIRFGIENASFYRLMFGPELLAAGGLSEDVVGAAGETRAVLDHVIRRGRDSGSFDLDDDEASVSAAVVAAWSIVHGFTKLAIDGMVPAPSPAEVGLLADSVTARLTRGLEKRPRT